MKKFNNRIPFLLFGVLLICQLSAFAGNSKLYLATNKETYSPSESVQFQIFLLNAPNTNKTVYVELLDCKGNKLAKKMLPLTSSISWGNLKAPQTDTSAFYILYCYVISKDTVEVDCNKKIYIKHNNVTENIEDGQESIINFYTEGGTFVALMPNSLLISFKDEYGNPLAGTGKITDSKNYGITNFVIDESGYAKTSFKPEFNVNYFIVIKNKAGKEIKKELPQVSQLGVNLTVMVNKDSLTYAAYSFTGDENQLDYKLDILSDGKTVYKSDINFVISLSVIQETISLKDLTGGFLSFRLTDKKNKLYAQRIIYNPIENGDDVLLNIIDTINKKRAAVKIPGYANGYTCLSILEKNNAAVTANKAVSKYFKDYVEQPVILSDPGSEISFNDFLITMDKQPYQQVAQPVNNNPFLTLSGIAYDSENKPLKNNKLNLIFLSKDLKKQYKAVTTDRSGSFEISSLIFYDTIKLYYQLADNSDEKNNIRVDLKVTPASYFSGNASKYIRFICADNTAKTTIPGTKNDNNINITDTSFKTEKTLKEVTVKGTKEKAKSNTQKFIEENVSGQNNQSNFLRNEFDFIANPQVIDNTPIFEFLRGRLNLIINISAKGNVKIGTTSGAGIGVYLDDMEITGDLDLVTHLTVKDLALVRYYSLPLKPRLESTKTKYSGFFGGGNSGGGGDLMIYTKKGFTPTEQMVKGLPKTSIIGYDQDDPVNDLPSATTPQSLYWKPNWLPKKEETIYIGLPAAEPEKKVQLIIEGINSAQLPFTFTKNLVFN
jgi:hypothetical protein